MEIRPRPKQQLEMLIIAIEALSTIKHREGRVCMNFEECKHEACQSSYNSWAIADKALKDIHSTD